jgi:membrane protease YdiL (CAAX protease family)
VGATLAGVIGIFALLHFLHISDGEAARKAANSLSESRSGREPSSDGILLLATVTNIVPIVLMFLFLRAKNYDLIADFSSAKPIAILQLLIVSVGIFVAMHHPRSVAALRELHFRLSDNPVLSIACNVFLAPIAEEFFFRGYLLSWLDRIASRLAAVLVSAVIFSFLHTGLIVTINIGDWPYYVSLFILGAACATWAYRTHSLWPGIFAHGLYNALSLAVKYH